MKVGDNYNPQTAEFVEFLRSQIRSTEVDNIHPWSLQFLRPSNLRKLVSRQIQNLVTVSHQRFSQRLLVVNRLLLIVHSVKNLCPFENVRCSQIKLPMNGSRSLKHTDYAWVVLVQDIHRYHVLPSTNAKHAIALIIQCYILIQLYIFTIRTSGSSHHLGGPYWSITSYIFAGRKRTTTQNRVVVNGTPRYCFCWWTATYTSRIVRQWSTSQLYHWTSRLPLMLRRCHSPVNVTTFASTDNTIVRGKSTVPWTP